GDTAHFVYDPGVLGGHAPPGAEVALLGTFNRWQKSESRRRWRMKRGEDGSFRLSLPLKKVKYGSRFKFKVVGKQGSWAPGGGDLVVRPLGGVRVELEGRLELGRRYDLVLTGGEGKEVRREVVPRVFLHEALSSYSTDRPLGARCTPKATTFRVFAPTARKVEVLLYEGPTGGEARVVELKREDRGTLSATLEEDLHGRYYTLRVEAPGTHPKHEFIDPYSRCNTAHDGRGMVLDMRRTDPAGFREHSRPAFAGVTKDGTPNSPEDAIIYEAHVRDFTIDKSSGVSHRGKYLGFVESGKLGGLPTGLDHLRDLGVTHVQIMPLQDFDNDEGGKGYNWGYMPVHFGSPEGWYATRRDDETRVRETKRMVQGLHAAGLRVILDVVYNHTSGAASFDRLAPFYYYRLRPFSDDPYWNGSGCGNEFRSESPMGRRFIVDSIREWSEEYKLDGFRFDLMGLIDRETMVQVARAAHEVDRSLLVYGEPWTGGDTPIHKTEKGRQQGAGFGVFNDILRDAIKGSNGDGQTGFVQTGAKGFADKIKNGLEGAVNVTAGGFASDPGETLNYVACHDNKTLWDKLLEDESLSPELRVRAHRLATSIVLLAQGVPFLHSGQEMQRTKRGEHNSYNLPDKINKLDWRLRKKHKQTYEHVRGMIALRKAHPVLRLSTRDEILGRRLRFRDSANEVVAFELDGADLEGETWGKVFVAFNGARQARRVELPAGRWKCVADHERAGVATLGELSGSLELPPLGLVVCHGS
ncbi:MAG TPA: type I pullulanase, partial [Planctomycetes bacterium]|nr:type I pullulanase [Planctomycetota bacterium]